MQEFRDKKFPSYRKEDFELSDGVRKVTSLRTPRTYCQTQLSSAGPF